MALPMLGIGLLVNTLQSVQQQSQANGAMAQFQAQNQLSQTLSQTKVNTKLSDNKLFNFDEPEFPEENYQNLQEMQTNHANERTEATNNLQNQLGDAKSSFFEENHYGTTPDADGKPTVALNDQGQPTVMPGAENGEQKLTRTQYETTQKAALSDRQAGEQDKFMGDEKANTTKFLTENKANLNDPYIQGQLQQNIVNSKKKALQLSQKHEDERWKVDLPPTSDFTAMATEGTAKLHSMDQRHMEAEENSEDANALMAHDRKVSALMGDQRGQAQQEDQNQNFLKGDPRKMFAAQAAKASQPQDVGQHLPGYLTSQLYGMGIYHV